MSQTLLPSGPDESGGGGETEAGAGGETGGGEEEEGGEEAAARGGDGGAPHTLRGNKVPMNTECESVCVVHGVCGGCIPVSI